MTMKNTGVFSNIVSLLLGSYPSSKNLSFLWNGGSFVAFCMVFQVVSGLLLVLYYLPSVKEAFVSVDYMTRESFWGFLIRVFHLNFASVLFVSVYFHISRGLMFSSYRIFSVWMSGVLLLFLIMMTAFLGYVLPWGQMSFWGATVITSLLSVVPVIGQKLVFWVWGGYCLGKASLSVFFLLHFLVPFVIMGFTMVHLVFLHMSSSTSSVVIHESFSKVKFTPYFSSKDFLNLVLISIFFGISLFNPWKLGDPENWLFASPMASPLHILPEWYFLYAYAILRCIPNKLGGVIALVLSVAILGFLPLFQSFESPKTKLVLIFMTGMMVIFFQLTLFGSKPVEDPYILLSQIFTFLFFSYFLLLL